MNNTNSNKSAPPSDGETDLVTLAALPEYESAASMIEPTMSLDEVADIAEKAGLDEFALMLAGMNRFRAGIEIEAAR